MLEVNVKTARSRFSQLLDKVEQGQDILLTRRGQQVARLVAPGKKCRLPSLKEFRQTVTMPEKGLSSSVLANREQERF